MEANEIVNTDRRQSESPARTIDSIGSTVGSMETIVDRNEELMQITVAASTNSTNLGSSNNNHNSLTNSQASILSKDEKAQDSQSHIYSSPVYMTTTEKQANQLSPESPKLITHAEFEKQLLTLPKSTEMAKSPTATLDSKISKKQRFPPELIKIKGDSAKDFKVGRRSSLPNQVTLGVVQFLLSIALVALGGLLIVRGASLAAVGCGIWTGGIAAIAGALGVINMRKVQTGFLALSLVCIATSTLALAISGLGLTRDLSKLQEKSNPVPLNYEKITAAYWLIFTLGLHFIVSAISVYKSASRLCSRSTHNELCENYNNAGIPVNQETIDEYIKAMSLSSGAINLMKKKQFAPQLIYSSLKSGSAKDTLGSPSIVLIPASLGNTLLPPTQQPLPPMMRPPPCYPMMLPPGVTVPPLPLVYRGGMTLPHKRPGRYSYGSYCSQMLPSNRHHRQHAHPPPALAGEINGRHSNAHRRTKDSSGRRQRRKSDTDAENRKAFTYTGLDRQLADSFLARQEQTNGSHIDYTSSGESAIATRNDCPDVVM